MKATKKERHSPKRSPSLCDLQNTSLPQLRLTKVAKIELERQLSDLILRLEGELGLVLKALPQLGAKLQMCSQFKVLTIEAGDLTLIPEEVDGWICFVNECLHEWTLHYAPSQLTEVLRYEDSYVHANSSFAEFGGEPVRHTVHVEYAFIDAAELSDIRNTLDKRPKGRARHNGVVLQLGRDRLAEESFEELGFAHA